MTHTCTQTSNSTRCDEKRVGVLGREDAEDWVDGKDEENSSALVKR
jgi:hypothetical protein